MTNSTQFVRSLTIFCHPGIKSPNFDTPVTYENQSLKIYFLLLGTNVSGTVHSHPDRMQSSNMVVREDIVTMMVCSFSLQ